MSYLLGFIKKIKIFEKIGSNDNQDDRAIAAFVGGHDNKKFIFIKSLETRSKGALGKAEIKVIIDAMDFAIEQKLPVILFVNSAGAKLDEGVAIQASFRRLINKSVELKMSDLKFIVLMGENVFGGASMLSMCGDCRLYEENTKISMTGPKILEIHNQLDSSEVNKVITSLSRVKIDEDGYYINKEEQVERVISFELSISKNLRPYRNNALERFIKVNNYQSERVKFDGNKIRCIGIESPSFLDLITLIIFIDKFELGSAGTIECQWASHSLDLQSESFLQSKILISLAVALRVKCLSGCKINTLITNSVSGGLYIALAAGSEKITLQKGAEVLSLPIDIINLIKTKKVVAPSPSEETSEKDLVDLGVVDSL